MPDIIVNLPHHSYTVHIQPDALLGLGKWARLIAPHSKAALLADSKVLETHGFNARQSLEQADYQVVVHAVPSGEAHKTLDTVRKLYDVLLDAHLERRSPIIALGGGVTGDIVGFVAATYLRGVPLIQCPTTLLAMVDSSVGGKVGVDVPQGKNLIGAFYQPSAVVIDTDCLRTLPKRELCCGLAECVKHAVIRDGELFNWIDHHSDKILRLDRDTLVELVARNVQIKAQVVMADEKEAGERAHLNFGHTFGHALETTTGYHTYPHGQAVALGMVAATKLAVDLGRCPPEVLPRLIHLLERLELPVHASDLPTTALLLDAMLLDKKVVGGKLRLVLPERLGAATLVADVPTEAVATAWEAIRRK